MSARAKVGKGNVAGTHVGKAKIRGEGSADDFGGGGSLAPRLSSYQHGHLVGGGNVVRFIRAP
jgi:hypothetical protein